MCIVVCNAAVSGQSWLATESYCFLSKPIQFTMLIMCPDRRVLPGLYHYHFDFLFTLIFLRKSKEANKKPFNCLSFFIKSIPEHNIQCHVFIERDCSKLVR